MKNLIKSATLLVLLSSLSSVSSAAVNHEQFETGPRCTPYPDCLGTANPNNKAENPSDQLSEIYRFDKMLKQ